MRFTIAALVFPLALASPLATSTTSGNEVQPTLAPLSTTGDHIDDSYIIVFKDGINLDQIALHLSGVEQWHGADVSSSAIELNISSPFLSTTVHNFVPQQCFLPLSS